MLYSNTKFVKINYFDWSIIGHLEISYLLQKAMDQQKIAPAYIFIGPDHIGKTTMAEQFICSLQCFTHHYQEKKKIKKIPCRQCLHCRQFQKKMHPDIIVIKKKEEQKNIGIEEIRELQHRLNLRSFLPTYKIALIKNAESLSTQAYNSLLKTLEEPTLNTVIILLTNNINIMPATIISRCQTLHFLPVAKKEIYNYLITQGEKRNIALYLANLCAGKPGMAINFYRKKELFDEYQLQIDQFLDLFSSNLNQRWQVLDNFFSHQQSNIVIKKILDQLINSWISIVRDLILIKYNHHEFILNVFIKEKLRQITQPLSLQKIKNILQQLELTKSYLADNINPKLALENFIINL